MEEKEFTNSTIEESSTLINIDTFVKIQALFQLLVEKNILTQEEIQGAVDNQTKLFLKPFLEKSGISDIDNVIDTLLKNRKL